MKGSGGLAGSIGMLVILTLGAIGLWVWHFSG